MLMRVAELEEMFHIVLGVCKMQPAEWWLSLVNPVVH